MWDKKLFRHISTLEKPIEVKQLGMPIIGTLSEYKQHFISLTVEPQSPPIIFATLLLYYDFIMSVANAERSVVTTHTIYLLHGRNSLTPSDFYNSNFFALSLRLGNTSHSVQALDVSSVVRDLPIQLRLYSANGV